MSEMEKIKEFTDLIQWQFNVKKLSVNSYTIHMTAFIQPPWRLYSIWNHEKAPMHATFKFEESAYFKCIGEPTEKGLVIDEYDKNIQATISYFNTKVEYVQEIQTFTQGVVIKGVVSYFASKEAGTLPLKKLRFLVGLE